MSHPPTGSKSTTSLRKHLLAVEKATGRTPKELLNLPRLPETLAYLWQWYVELHSSESLTFTEINAWSQLTGIKLATREIAALRKLDAIFWEVSNGRSLTSNNQGKQ